MVRTSICISHDSGYCLPHGTSFNALRQLFCATMFAARLYIHVHLYTSLLKLHMRFKVGIAKIVQNSVARQRQMGPV